MRIPFLALSVLLFVTLVSSQQLLVDNVFSSVEISSSSNSPGQWTGYWQNIYQDGFLVNVTYYPCFGFMNLYVGQDFAPSIDNYTLHFPWVSDVFQLFALELDPAESIYFLMVATNTFTGSTISAAFDIIVNSGYIQTDNGVPVPGNGGLISGALTNQGAQGHLTWTFTNNKADNYTMYALNATAFNTNANGFYALNGCSVQRSMYPLNTGVTFTISGNSETADFTNLNPKKTLPVTVLAYRPGGYSSAYEVIYLNSASVFGVALPLLVSAFIFSILF